jgi:hypothetical protein
VITTRSRPTVFAPSDDLLHAESSSGSHARESLALAAPIPDSELGVFAYVWREGGSRWGRFVFVAGPDLTKPEFVDFSADAVHSGDDLRDFEVGGLRWRQPDPLHTAEISYTAGELDLTVRFESLHPPFSWHDNADGLRHFIAADRFEQTGRTQIRLNLRVREIVHSGLGQRDHSWGPRNWAFLQHWKWINCFSLDGATALHCMVTFTQGEVLTNGYLYREGTLSPVASASVAAEYDATMHHRVVRGEFKDKAGRTAVIEAVTRAGWSMPISNLYLNESAMTATMDGTPAAAHIEFGWQQDYLHAITAPTF